MTGDRVWYDLISYCSQKPSILSRIIKGMSPTAETMDTRQLKHSLAAQYQFQTTQKWKLWPRNEWNGRCDTQICSAVAEGTSAHTGIKPITTSEDGSSLMALHCITKYEAYAGGALNFFKCVFLHCEWRPKLDSSF